MIFQKNRRVSSLSMEDAAKELLRDPSIVLLDVRTDEEYASGHIPGSILLPLDRLAEVDHAVPDRDSRIFVYCLSGARSQQACLWLARSGYTNVTNIGGISRWTGRIERTAGR